MYVSQDIILITPEQPIGANSDLMRLQANPRQWIDNDAMHRSEVEDDLVIRRLLGMLLQRVFQNSVSESFTEIICLRRFVAVY